MTTGFLLALFGIVVMGGSILWAVEGYQRDCRKLTAMLERIARSEHEAF